MKDEVIATIVESLANNLELCAAYNQIWVLRPCLDHNGNKTLAAVDERSDEVKYVFYNPDAKMKELIEEVSEIGWIATKQKYLTNRPFKVSIVEN